MESIQLESNDFVRQRNAGMKYAFWIGYHRSAAMRGLGAPGMALGMIVLLYVAARIGYDVAGAAGAIVPVASFIAIEAYLFWATRPAV